MPKIVFNSRKEWLAGRKLGIGASDWAAILRKSNFATPLTVWLDKITPSAAGDDGLLGDGNDFNFAASEEYAEWGLRLEPAIAQAVMDRTGRRVVMSDQHSLYRDDATPYLQASPDSFQIATGKDPPELAGVGVLQIKTTDRANAKFWRNGAPVDYQIQVQAEMRVTGAKWGSLVCLVGGNKMIGPLDYMRNDAFIASVEPILADFWDRVQKLVPPDFAPDELTAEVLAKLYEKDDGSTVELGPEFEQVVAEWQRAGEIKRTAEKIEKANKTKLATALENATYGRLPGGEVVSYRQINRAAYSVAASSYRKLALENTRASGNGK